MNDYDFAISIEHSQAVAEALEQAKETIYIADWWLSPELVNPLGEFSYRAHPW
jgi:hypothetical protein